MEDKDVGRKEVREQRGQGMARVIFGIHTKNYARS